MTNETEQLRRLVDARGKATKGPWICKAQSGVGNQQIDLLDEIVPEYSPDQKLVTLRATAWKPYRAKSIRPTAEFIALSGTIDLHAILTRMEKMEAALKPFADAATEAEKWGGAAESVIANSVSLSDCKRARDALE